MAKATDNLTVTDGDFIEWTGASLPSGMFPEHNLVLYPGEEYEVGEEIGADFANALIADGHCRKVVKQPVKPATIPLTPSPSPADTKSDTPKEAAKPAAE